MNKKVNENRKLFSKAYIGYLVQIGLHALIAYYLFSAIKGEWILSPERLLFW